MSIDWTNPTEDQQKAFDVGHAEATGIYEDKVARLTTELAAAQAALVRCEKLAYDTYQPQVAAAQAACAEGSKRIYAFLKFENDSNYDSHGQDVEWMNHTEALAEWANENPGQAILDENAKLREAVDKCLPVLDIVRTYGCECDGGLPTPDRGVVRCVRCMARDAEAALAGLEALKEPKY